MKAQFSTFTNVSYEGNPLLCGPPLPRNCSSSVQPNNTSLAPSYGVEEEDDIDMGIIEEKLEQKLDEQPPDLRNDKSVQDDVFLQVMGPERNGRVRGAGKAIAPSNVGLAQSNVQKKKEDEELQATISNMQGEINDLKEQLTEMDQIKTQLTEMDQMKAQLKEMDQLKAQLTQMDQMKAQIVFLTQAFTGRNTSQSSIHLCFFCSNRIGNSIGSVTVDWEFLGLKRR
ncbi:hypothetical protein NE237_026948 [Protea cynaroides]|uniref:Uncharacterized protein n=1 Tax=Protea cynaroides TaxID=273540 RepID=A0A9Q0JSI7_9MAGN|nr:hypothetical protein NE237_026948 [Protea cynaroides]